MCNHLLAWQGRAWRYHFHLLATESDGKRFLVGDIQVDEQSPYYFKDGPESDYKEAFNMIHIATNGSPG